MKFVEKNLEDSNTLTFYERIFEFKNNVKNKNLLKKIMLIPIYFNQINLLIKLIKWIYSGDFISKSISQKWLVLNKITN